MKREKFSGYTKKSKNMFGLNKTVKSAMPIADFIAVFQIEKKTALPISVKNNEI
ncbi:MAG: hypothetical protein ACOXZH_00320 [Bacteroidales bacterium]|jgi:hypothetical protein